MFENYLVQVDIEYDVLDNLLISRTKFIIQQGFTQLIKLNIPAVVFVKIAKSLSEKFITAYFFQVNRYNNKLLAVECATSIDIRLF